MYQYVDELSRAIGDAEDLLQPPGLARLFHFRGHSAADATHWAAAHQPAHRVKYEIQGAKRRSEMTPKEKVAFVKQHGENAFMRLPQ